jgi:SAM-dependent methyltransferase
MTMIRIPPPAPMAIDSEKWKSELHLSLFVNTYYQLRDLQRLGAPCKRVLVIGSGQGLDRLVFQWKGYEVTTVDIDSRFDADVIGSVHDLSIFDDASFDAVIASHVLEHLAEPYLDASLKEIARVGRAALIYLPVHGRHMQFRFIPGFKGIDVSFILDIFNYFERPTGLRPQYMAGQHYWEVGMRGFRLHDLQRRFEVYFDIVACYRNRDWIPSQNFVLQSK